MEFDRTKHTLEATRSFDRGQISKKSGDVLDAKEIAAIGDADVFNLVQIARVAKIVTIEDGEKKAKAAAKAEKAEKAD